MLAIGCGLKQVCQEHTNLPRFVMVKLQRTGKTSPHAASAGKSKDLSFTSNNIWKMLKGHQIMHTGVGSKHQRGRHQMLLVNAQAPYKMPKEPVVVTAIRKP